MKTDFTIFNERLVGEGAFIRDFRRAIRHKHRDDDCLSEPDYIDNSCRLGMRCLKDTINTFNRASGDERVALV